jgi:hypothetical protein
MFVVNMYLCVCSQSIFNTRETPVNFRYIFCLNFKVDFLNVNKSEHEEVGHGSDLGTVVSQWENFRMGPVMAHWKVIDLDIDNM